MKQLGPDSDKKNHNWDEVERIFAFSPVKPQCHGKPISFSKWNKLSQNF